MAKRLTRKEQQEVTRRRLLDAADRVFLRRGFTAATVEQIAADAGYTPGAVYANFNGKLGLYNELRETRATSQIMKWQILIDEGLPPQEQLQRLGDLLVEELQRMAPWTRAEIEFTMFVAARPKLRRQILALQDRTDEQVAQLLVELCRLLGVQPPLAPTDLARAVIALANGLSIHAALDPGFDLAHAFQSMIAALLGVAGPAPSAAPDSRAAFLMPAR